MKLVLKDTGLLTQEAEMGVAAPIDACDGFNKLFHLAMMCTVWHFWTAGQSMHSIGISFEHSFSSNRQGSLLITLLSLEGLTQG